MNPIEQFHRLAETLDQAHKEIAALPLDTDAWQDIVQAGKMSHVLMANEKIQSAAQDAREIAASLAMMAYPCNQPGNGEEKP